MKIYAPVSNFNGLIANIMFRNGVGETDRPHLIEWFQKRGYKIESDIEAENAYNRFNSMTVEELRDWMKDNGYGSQIRNVKNKEKLIGMIEI